MEKQFATMVVFNDDQTEVLLFLREDFRLWALPGGGLEAGKSPVETAIRETLEETGYDAEIIRFCSTYHRPQLKDTRYVFLGCIIGGQVLQSGPETRAVRLYTLAQLPWNIVPFLKEIITDTKDSTGQPFVKNQTMASWQVGCFRLLLWLRNLRNRLSGRV